MRQANSIVISLLTCKRCGYTWYPKPTKQSDGSFKAKPKICPKCKSPYWNIPRMK